MRLRRTATARETLIANVAHAWGQVKSAEKPALMLAHPDLYWACARLSAHEAARKEMGRKP